ncbi:hypothetical protein HK100_001789 [Physocladia obscura]|uniref:F-box domain-containing protein n=1 Tax=Physocladia obscura TaxID=109957 RepID=A0AAD5TAM9_9FUNG|nr:hypothetical protein HK100_001789 [Physocladia obscura]
MTETSVMNLAWVRACGHFFSLDDVNEMERRFLGSLAYDLKIGDTETLVAWLATMRDLTMATESLASCREMVSFECIGMQMLGLDDTSNDGFHRVSSVSSITKFCSAGFGGWRESDSKTIVNEDRESFSISFPRISSRKQRKWTEFWKRFWPPFKKATAINWKLMSREINQLPDELLQQILEHLPVDSIVLKNIALASRRFGIIIDCDSVAFARRHLWFQAQINAQSLWYYLDENNIKFAGFRALPFAYRVAVFGEVLQAEQWDGNTSRNWAAVGYDEHLMWPLRWSLYSPPPSVSVSMPSVSKQPIPNASSPHFRLVQMLAKTHSFDAAANDNRAIRWCSMQGCPSTVTFLLSLPCVDPAARHNAALGDSCRLGNIEVVQLLLNDPRCNPSDHDNYAIRQTTWAGHKEILKLLLLDPRVDPACSNNKCIQIAVQNNNFQFVQLLLADSRVDCSADNNWCLREACHKGYNSIVKMLLANNKSDPRTLNQDCLRLSVQAGKSDTVEILLKDGRADPIAENNWCLRNAAIQGQAAIVKILLSDSRVSIPQDLAERATLLSPPVKDILLHYSPPTSLKKIHKVTTDEMIKSETRINEASVE